MKKLILHLFFGLVISVTFFSCNVNKINNQNKTDTSIINQPDKIISSQKGIENNNSKSCLDVVEDILTTSPRYMELTDGLHKAIVKNGGTSFGITLEGSPNPKNDVALDFSKTYDFNIHESYPDRSPVIFRFTFDPSNKQLYEYDIINDKLLRIDFDRDLLIIINKICE